MEGTGACRQIWRRIDLSLRMPVRNNARSCPETFPQVLKYWQYCSPQVTIGFIFHQTSLHVLHKVFAKSFDVINWVFLKRFWQFVEFTDCLFFPLLQECRRKPDPVLVNIHIHRKYSSSNRQLSTFPNFLTKVSIPSRFTGTFE